MKYKDFGVDIETGNRFVSVIKDRAKSTFSQHVLGGIGGFSAAFEIPSGYENPVLCATTDGVGSKLKLALEYDKLHGIGIDLVAMCVNDLLCSFAKPMFFLDYYATHSIDIARSSLIIDSIIEGCCIAGCSLIGGESAEMPSIYDVGDFDLAGFCVGIAERVDLSRRPCSGDLIFGIPSSGFHSNGYSLLRGVLAKTGDSIVDDLLVPTRIYVDEFMKLRGVANAFAHITGGGLCENVVRVLGDDVRAVIDRKKIRSTSLFDEVSAYVDMDEMYKVFNMGVGMVVIIPESLADVVATTDAYEIGHIEHGAKDVVLE